jgi:subtilisin family serine protease/regulation of enolase protein 1 (concanavalin A-like superfamily)
LKNTVIVSLVAAGVWLAWGVAPDAQQRAGIQQVDHPLIGRYIVVLRDADDALAVGTATANLSGGRLRHVYDTAINGFAADLSEGAARALAADPRVEYVEQDGALTLAAAAQGVRSWGLDRINQRTLDATSQVSRDGTGVNVHVVDTGIRVSHAEFGGRAFIAGDYVEDDGDGADCHGHGTHVAGTIGGATHGVAKNATLWAHRVLDCTGAGATSALIAAVDAITRDSMRRPAVVSIGLVAPASRALDAAIRRSIASGLTYVVAAGNGNADAAGLSPARIADAITVGASTARDRRAGFSNFGAVVDLFAPGQAIVSAAIAHDTASTTMSGTSVAAAHVAGVAALHLGDRPAARPADVQAALLSAATAGVLTDLGAGSPNRLLSSEAPADYSEVVVQAAAQTAEPLAALAAGPSDNADATTTSAARSVTVTGGLPTGWTATDVGSPAIAGSTAFANGTFTIRAGGVDIWNTADEFQFVYRPISGDVDVVARVASVEAADIWSKAGVMIRGTLAGNAANAAMIVPAASGAFAFQRRLAAGHTTIATMPPGQPPAWVKLERRGGAITAFTSANGTSWTLVATETMTLPSTVYVGLAVSSHNPSQATTAVLDNVSITAPANQAPSVSLSAPADGATFTAPATMTVSANANDTDGTIARVDFYQGATLIGSDTSSPYSVTWSNVAAGSYSLTAVATRRRRRGDHLGGAQHHRHRPREPAAERLADRSSRWRHLHRAGHHHGQCQRE